MIIQEPVPQGWNKHHTLYYRRWYNLKETTRAWRNSEPMIVPVEISRHNALHDAVPPITPIPSDALAGYALHICHDIIEDRDQFSRYEAFNVVRNELEDMAKRRRRLEVRSMGEEALRLVDFFDEQLDYMCEDPVLKLDDLS